MRLLLTSLIICLGFDVFAQSPQLGRWDGNVNDGSVSYNYTVNINAVRGDSLFGTAISQNPSFFCETLVRGVQLYNTVTISEKSIIRTSLPKPDQVCLLSMELNLKNNRLNGEFRAADALNRGCGSGKVELKISETSMSRPVSALVRQKERNMELTNTLLFGEDSVMVKVYDNGIIDGDVITLMVNDEELFPHAKLTAEPLTFVLRAKDAQEHLVSFVAETLGNIPPNTGLIIVTSASTRKELQFSSDFSKTASLKIVFRK